MTQSKIITSWKELKAPIGIIGGTFDPIQRAHIEIAERAMEKKSLGSVVFVPARQNPLKNDSPSASDHDRTAMLSLAIQNIPNFYISTVELLRPQNEPSYTVLTVREARVACGSNTPIYFIAGGDVIPTLPRWNKIEEIFSYLTGFIVIQREKPLLEEIDALSGLLSDESIKILRRDAVVTGHVEISSSDIRRDIHKGINVSEQLDPAVWEYIQRHSLYL